MCRLLIAGNALAWQSFQSYYIFYHTRRQLVWNYPPVWPELRAFARIRKGKRTLPCPYYRRELTQPDTADMIDRKTNAWGA